MAKEKEIETVLEYLQKLHPAEYVKMLLDGKLSTGEILYLLSESPSTVGTISKLMKISKARVSVMLKKMEEQGWITREINPQDARIIFVHLSEEGEKKVQQLRREKYEKVEAVIDAVGMERILEYIAISNEIKDVMKTFV